MAIVHFVNYKRGTQSRAAMRGVMFYHMVQSFPKGAAVDPRQAREAARRLAEYFAGCEVLVCTHVDREHIHSHCVINSVNFETGKKLHMAKEQI